MSGHADTIRTALTFTDAHSERYALNALDALLAENQRLREALVGLLDAVEDYGLDAAFGDEKFKTIVAAREALAGDTE